MTIKNETDVHKVNYLIHSVSGHVVTSQVKAWNDTVRTCMWFELVMLPIRNKLGKMLMWCDNCGSHLTQAVKNVIKECDIDVAYLPKNMTAELQVSFSPEILHSVIPSYLTTSEILVSALRAKLMVFAGYLVTVSL